MKQKRLLRTLLVALCLLTGTTSLWAYTETLSGADATTKDNSIIKTSFTMLRTYNPGSSTTINEKNCLKVRWKTKSTATGNVDGFALMVNPGYKITQVVAQMSGNSSDLTLADIKVDGTSYSGSYSKTLKGSEDKTTKYTDITLSDISATEYINFEYSSGGNSNQGFVYITVTYEEDQSTIYTKNPAGWSSEDVTTTENTVGKWYHTLGYQSNGNNTGLSISGEKGLKVTAVSSSANPATTTVGELTFNHTDNSIITLDAVWNVGSTSSDGNTPYVMFSFGDLTIKQNIRSNNLNTYYTINGKQVNPGSDKFARDDEMTIHLKVNSYTRAITEFFIKNGETIVAQFSDLTSANNTFAEGSKYNVVKVTTCSPASGSQRSYCYLKSLTVSEQEQAIYSYTVNAIDNSSKATLWEIATGETLKGVNPTIGYPHYVIKGNNLYSRGATNKEYRQPITVEKNNDVIEFPYTESKTNAIYYSEAELIPETTENTSSTNVAIRASRGTVADFTAPLSICTLPAGTYNILLGVHHTSNNSNVTSSFSIGGQNIDMATTATNLTEEDSEEFTITSAGELKCTGVAGNGKLDYICVYGTPTNDIVGSIDYSTGYLEDMTDKVTLKPGESYKYKFVNYNSGSTSQWLNFVVPVYTSTDVKTLVIRADNYEDVKGTNAGCTNNFVWGDAYATFIAEMNGATVDMTISYSASNVLTMNAAIKTKSGYDWTYSYTTDYSGSGISLEGNIKVALSVSNSWLEVLSEGKSALSTTTTAAGKGWATLYTDVPLDFENATPAGLKAYTATLSNNTVTLSPVDNVPAGTGVVLKSSTTNANTTYSIPVAASSSTEKGDLQGSTAALAYENFDTNNAYYVLATAADESGDVQFRKVTSGTIAAGKAYLKVATAGAKALTVVFADDVTGISNVNAEEAAQPVKRIVKGQLVIEKNGKHYNAAGAEF